MKVAAEKATHAGRSQGLPEGFSEGLPKEGTPGIARHGRRQSLNRAHFGGIWAARPMITDDHTGRCRPVRLAAQDAALSRRKQGFESPTGRHFRRLEAGIGRDFPTNTGSMR